MSKTKQKGDQGVNVVHIDPFKPGQPVGGQHPSGAATDQEKVFFLGLNVGQKRGDMFARGQPALQRPRGMHMPIQSTRAACVGQVFDTCGQLVFASEWGAYRHDLRINFIFDSYQIDNAHHAKP